MNTLMLTARSAMSNTAVKVLDLEGVLDINTVGVFEDELQRFFKEKQYKIVINMEKLTYISSAGFGVLMSIIKDIRKNRGDIKIACASPEIYKVFELLELPSIFHILKTEQNAVEAF